MSVFIKCNERFEKFVGGNKEFIERETRSKVGIGTGEGGYVKKWGIEGDEVQITIQ